MMETNANPVRRVKKIKVRLKETQNLPLAITTPFIRLDAALKFSGVAETGGHAKLLVEEGRVRVNGEQCLSRGKKLYPGDTFEYQNRRFTVTEEHADHTD